MEGPIAKWYASLTRKSLDEFKALARRIRDEVPPPAKVLEVAPGPGYFAIELAKLGGYSVTGLDISETFVKIAQDNAADAKVDVNFRRGNASGMPFKSGSFDYLLCRAAFKNFSQPLPALREMHRVLRPGGRALIIDLRRDSPKGSITRVVDDMKLGAVNGIITKLTFRFMLLKRAYTRDEIQGLLSQTGFKEIEIREDLIGLEVLLRKDP